MGGWWVRGRLGVGIERSRRRRMFVVIWSRFGISAMRTGRCGGSDSDIGSGSSSSSCGAPPGGVPAGAGTGGGFVEVPRHAEAKQAALNILQASSMRAIIAARRRGVSNHSRRTRRLFRLYSQFYH